MKEKLLKLEEAKNKLKSEFVGLDSIIDRIIDIILPWYLTPEILDRPTVVSLWGLTGTGKTSLVRKLVSYLEISEKSLFFDCGEQGGETDYKLFSEKLDDLFESSRLQEGDPRYNDLKKLGIDQDTNIMKTDPINFTFVFDEFQYLRTKNPNTDEEESKPEGRAIWNLMDSGLVDINKYNYKVRSLMDYIEDLEFFSNTHPNIQISKGRFNPSVNKILKQQLSYFRWADEEIPVSDDNKKKVNKGYPIILDEDFSFLIKKLNIIKSGLGFSVSDKISSYNTLSEFIEDIKPYIDLISKPKVINCSKSLIFVLGNLDEAFQLNSDDDIDPDVDADVFHEITSKVTCMDIKTALRRRFRDEQVGRLGNNLIIYPSLRKSDFKKIIERELDRITKKFEESYDIKVNITDRFKDLVYFEGCFPIQGVRPILSTISSLISPLLSIILVNNSKEKEVFFDVNEERFSVPEIKLVVYTADEKRIGEKIISLALGSLRSPSRCKKIGLQSIHEASHAIIYRLLTGKLPSALIASNIFGDGGYMMNDIDKEYSVTNIREFRNDVIVSLAGYFGEREFFDEDMCSLGATSDISNVWRVLSEAFYRSGYIVPMKYSESNVSGENKGIPYGLPITKDIENSLKRFFDECCEETKRLIHKESRVIKEVAKYLIKNRSMGNEVLTKFISEYGIGFDSTIPGDDYYTKVLEND